MSEPVAPRIYCIAATHAPVVAVFRRGPTRWSHVGRWDLRERRYEPGSWLAGRVFPRRSDLSPDGRYLCTFTHKPGASWALGETYVSVSRLPWLTALHAFATCGTWTRGYHFTAHRSGGGSEVGDLPMPFGLRATPVVQFACERRRGWSDTVDSPVRSAADVWDARRSACIHKRQPGGARILCAQRVGRGAAGQSAERAIDGMQVSYWLETREDVEPLEHVQWADWDRDGHLLVATRCGRLQILDLDGDRSRALFDEDLSLFEPNPAPAPPWALQW